MIVCLEIFVTNVHLNSTFAPKTLETVCVKSVLKRYCHVALAHFTMSYCSLSELLCNVKSYLLPLTLNLRTLNISVFSLMHGSKVLSNSSWFRITNVALLAEYCECKKWKRFSSKRHIYGNIRLVTVCCTSFLMLSVI